MANRIERFPSGAWVMTLREPDTGVIVFTSPVMLSTYARALAYAQRFQLQLERVLLHRLKLDVSLKDSRVSQQA
jgi:hypothetical protein